MDRKSPLRWKALGAGLIVAACMAAAAARAASLHVAPVSVQMVPGRSSAELTLTNLGDRPVHAQVSVFAWRQNDGRDTLEPTQALVASPPMFVIAAQGTQTLRLLRVATSALAGEEGYRVLIDELHDAAAPRGEGSRVSLRYSIPVFASPPDLAPTAVTASTTIEGRAVVLKAQNAGGRHAQVSELALVNAGGDAVVVEAGLLGYVLAGRTMQWRLSIPPDALAHGPFVSLRCRINAELVSVPF